MTDLISITQETIQNQIYTIRGKQVMIDRDVFFELDKDEMNKLVTSCDRFKNLKHSTSPIKVCKFRA